jgi:SMC interacting uncharacterized protein involved in chromosome segregation
VDQFDEMQESFTRLQTALLPASSSSGGSGGLSDIMANLDEKMKSLDRALTTQDTSAEVEFRPPTRGPAAKSESPPGEENLARLLAQIASLRVKTGLHKDEIRRLTENLLSLRDSLAIGDHCKGLPAAIPDGGGSAEISILESKVGKLEREITELKNKVTHEEAGRSVAEEVTKTVRAAVSEVAKTLRAEIAELNSTIIKLESEATGVRNESAEKKKRARRRDDESVDGNGPAQSGPRRRNRNTDDRHEDTEVRGVQPRE